MTTAIDSYSLCAKMVGSLSRRRTSNVKARADFAAVTLTRTVKCASMDSGLATFWHGSP